MISNIIGTICIGAIAYHFLLMAYFYLVKKVEPLTEAEMLKKIYESQLENLKAHYRTEMDFLVKENKSLEVALKEKNDELGILYAKILEKVE